MTLPHLSQSRRSACAISSGEDAMTFMPSGASAEMNFGWVAACLISRARRSTIGCGVLAGAKLPNQDVTLHHVALYVSDCYKLSEKLKAEGVEFISGPAPNRPGGKDIYAFIKDPDGYVIELTERHATTGAVAAR